MLMKTKKRRLEQFLFYDYTGIEAHLAKMAMKGWQIYKITPFYWEYRRIEPQKLTYTVTYFSEASDFNPYPTENQLAFHDYCEEAGWKLVTQWAQMQIFCATRENPTPIETDEALKLKAIHKSMKKNFLPSSIALLLLSLFQIYFQFHLGVRSPVDFLSNGTTLSSIVIWGILALYMLTNLTVYAVWYQRSRKAASRGETGIESGSRYRKAQIVWLLLEGIAVTGMLLSLSSQYFELMGVWLIAYTALILIVLAIRNALKRTGTSRNTNILITVISVVVLALVLTGFLTRGITRSVNAGRLGRQPAETYTITRPNGTTHTWEIYHDTLPLTVEDLQDVDYDHYSYMWTARESFLLGQYVARQSALPDGRQAPELSYTIVDVKLPALYDICLNHYLGRYDDWDADAPVEKKRYFQETNGPAWKADRVYQLHIQEETRAEYILCWGSRIVSIHFDEAPTTQQIAIAVEKLTDYEGGTR
mgnify:CR=1 FL=1